MFIQKCGAGAALAGGTVVAMAVLGIGAARADSGADEINGWAVTPTGGSDSIGSLFGVPVTIPTATLSDPTDSLGLGTAPIAGVFDSAPATPLSSIGSNEIFATNFPTSSTVPLTAAPSDTLNINDQWVPGLELAAVQVVAGPGSGSMTAAVLVPSQDGSEVVDLWQFSKPDDPLPLFNPDATGPFDVGGLPLASPDDGALLNDLFNAAFLGDTADWGKAATLFDDWLGIDPSSAAAAVDPSWLTDFGF